MVQSWSGWYWKLGLASLLAIGQALANSGNYALAQIRPDSTLGAEPSVVIPNVVIRGLSSDRIDGGVKRGANLFHSFLEFNVGAGRGAYFTNPAGIENIINRVTGSNPSNIFGKLGVLGKANLFLINPNGIIFGPNASLDVRGSFVGSTASSLKFADGTEFSATAPQTTPLLTISVPVGLQFGANPGRILVQGDGQGVRSTTELIDTTAGLHVESNQTLAMVGGDVALEGGTLKTDGGRIELGSVAGPGLVSLTHTTQGWALGYDGVQHLGDIHLSQQADVDASGEGGGDVQVQGRQVTLQDGSQLEASTLGAVSGRTLTVRASDAVEISGDSSGLFAQVYQGARGAGGSLVINTGRLSVSNGASVSASTFGPGNGGNLTVNASDVELSGTAADGTPGGLFATVARGAKGNAGNLTINTGHLGVSDGTQVLTSSYGLGNAGNLNVNASDVELSGTGVNGPGGLYADAYKGSQGAGGNLTIDTGHLRVSDGAEVSASAFGPGNGGNLIVNASDVEVSGTAVDGTPGGLFAQVNPGAKGNGGNLNINTESLSVRDGAEVATSTFGSGDAGSLTVNASDSVELSGDGPKYVSGLLAQVDITGTGHGGNLTIDTGRLSVSNGSKVQVSTFGAGDAGELRIRASDVDVFDTPIYHFFSTGIFAETSRAKQPGSPTFEVKGSGNAGNLIIDTGHLSIRDGGQVSTSTYGKANAGRLLLQASDSVEVVGKGVSPGAPDFGEPSFLGASVQQGATGRGGDLTIETGQLSVRDGAQVAVNNQGSGEAGNLEVAARSIQLDNQGNLTAETLSGNGGNMTLQAQDFLLLRHGSQISTTAGNNQNGGNGGNITITNTPLIVAIPSENSDISANAFTGNGGKVTINTTGIFGTQFRQQPTPESDITASSTGGGINGVVNINTPLVDPSRGVAALPAVPINTNALIANTCIAGRDRKGGSFIVTGNGGLPTRPGDALVSPYPTGAVRSTTSSRASNASPETITATPPSASATVAIVPATGWSFNDKGQVLLTAQAPSATLYIPWLTPTTCHAR